MWWLFILLVATSSCDRILGIEDRTLRVDARVAGDGAIVPDVRLEIVAALPKLGDHAANTPLPPIAVRLIDPDGNVIANRSDIVQLRLLTPDPAVMLNGTLVREAVGGIAMFTDLSVNRPGSGLRLQASGGGAPVVLSEPFSISSAAILQQFRGSVTFSLGGFSGAAHAVGADVDNDGDRDLVAAVHDAKVVVFLNNGDGTFGSSIMGATGLEPSYVAVGDLNDDNFAEVVVANIRSDDLSVFIGGPGMLTPAMTIPVCNEPAGVVLDDVTGDGRKDIAVSCFGATNVSVFRNITTGAELQFATRQDLANQIGGCGTSLASGDMNRDGRQDLVAATFCANLGVLLQHDTTPNTFRTAQPFQTGGHNRNVALVDLDSDTDLDVVSGSGHGNQTANPLSFRLNTTAQNATSMAFAAQVNLVTAAPMGGEHWVSAVDVSGDGLPEIVSVFNNSSELLVFANNGGTPVTFGSRTVIPIEHVGRSVERADFDGDGREDLVVAMGSELFMILFTKL